MERAVQFHSGRKTPLIKLWHAVDWKMHSEFIDSIMWEKMRLRINERQYTGRTQKPCWQIRRIGARKKEESNSCLGLGPQQMAEQWCYWREWENWRRHSSGDLEKGQGSEGFSLTMLCSSCLLQSRWSYKEAPSTELPYMTLELGWDKRCIYKFGDPRHWDGSTAVEAGTPFPLFLACWWKQRGRTEGSCISQCCSLACSRTFCVPVWTRFPSTSKAWDKDSKPSH